MYMYMYVIKREKKVLKNKNRGYVFGYTSRFFCNHVTGNRNQAESPPPGRSVAGWGEQVADMRESV